MATLICLRGMVCLWMADVELERARDRDGDEDMGEGGESRRRAAALKAEARVFFRTVKEKGVAIPEGIEDAFGDEDDDEDMVDAD